MSNYPMFFSALKTVKEVLTQSEDRILTKMHFILAFFIHYSIKKIFGKRISFFPKMTLMLHGCRFITRKNTVDFWMVKQNHEKEFTSYLLNQDKKGIFIDVGTHIGRYSIILAKKGWEVFSFEPLKSNFNQLKLNISLNKIGENLHLYNIGLGNKKGKQTIFYERHKGGEASLIFHKEHSAEKIIIDKLDNILKFKKTGKVILKIDVEGFEYQVLKGASNFIKKNKPEIFIEIWDEDKKKDHELLNRLGYSKKGEIWVMSN